MAQNAFTVTNPNPTPPTNLSYVGNTPPLDPAQPYVDDGITAAVPNSRSDAAANGATINSPAGVLTSFAAKTAASNTPSAPGAGMSVDHEGLGATVPLSVSSILNGSAGTGGATMTTAWVVLNPPAYSSNPNSVHASSMTPATPLTPTIGSLSAGGAAGPGTTLLTVTGTNFNRTSVVNVNGVPQMTNYVSATSLTVASAPKKQNAGAGNVPVTVTSHGITTAPTNWVFT